MAVFSIITYASQMTTYVWRDRHATHMLSFSISEIQKLSDSCDT